jgi:hypothetical protein
VGISSSSYSYVSLESFVLMEDIGLAWLINYVQRSWPFNTLAAFVQHAQSAHIQAHPRLAKW